MKHALQPAKRSWVSKGRRRAEQGYWSPRAVSYPQLYPQVYPQPYPPGYHQQITSTGRWEVMIAQLAVGPTATRTPPVKWPTTCPDQMVGDPPPVDCSKQGCPLSEHERTSESEQGEPSTPIESDDLDARRYAAPTVGSHPMEFVHRGWAKPLLHGQRPRGGNPRDSIKSPRPGFWGRLQYSWPTHPAGRSTSG